MLLSSFNILEFLCRCILTYKIFHFHFFFYIFSLGITFLSLSFHSIPHICHHQNVKPPTLLFSYIINSLWPFLMNKMHTMFSIGSFVLFVFQMISFDFSFPETFLKLTIFMTLLQPMIFKVLPIYSDLVSSIVMYILKWYISFHIRGYKNKRYSIVSWKISKINFHWPHYNFAAQQNYHAPTLRHEGLRRCPGRGNAGMHLYFFKLKCTILQCHWNKNATNSTVQSLSYW